MIIASLLFKGREIFQIAWLAIFLFTGEVLGEYFGLLPHHHLPSAGEVAHELPFILMTLGSFWLVILFSAYVGALDHEAQPGHQGRAGRAGRPNCWTTDRAKMDFFRFVTHEIKSPVNTAQSAVETALELGGAALTPSVRDVLERAVSRLEQATGHRQGSGRSDPRGRAQGGKPAAGGFQSAGRREMVDGQRDIGRPGED